MKGRYIEACAILDKISISNKIQLRDKFPRKKQLIRYEQVGISCMYYYVYIIKI